MQFENIFKLIMKKAFLIFTFILAGFAFVSPTYAQDKEDSEAQFQAILEADAKSNLKIARYYFNAKKAYKAVLSRLEETIDAYPAFSEMDEVLYLAGTSSYYLSENKGKQKVDLSNDLDKDKYTPEKLRENAVAYLSLLVEKYPDSKFKEDAEGILKKLKPTK